MFRLVNLRFTRFPNTVFDRGELVACRNISKGQRIRIPVPDKKLRTCAEMSEIRRLAEESYKHAIRN